MTTMLLAAPPDPANLGWVGSVLALAGLLAALVVLLRAWFHHRDRR